MSKKGFTIVELLATIVILAIISTLAFAAYRNIQARMKETALKNKIAYIENASSNYANDTGNLVTIVQVLVDEGYIEPDDNNGVVKNPVTDEEMNCLVVNIREDQNNLYGELTDVKECDITNLEITNRNLNVDVFEKDTNRKLAGNEWTSKDVYLQVSFKDSSINKNNVKKITWISNSGREEVAINNDFDSHNRKDVTASLIINATYKVEILMNDDVKYQAQTNVKIDKQRPEIYEAENYIENENNYTNSDKLVRITATDFNGSGIAGYYIGTSNDCRTARYESSNNSTYEKSLDNGTYYACAKDKVGNLSEDISTKQIVINRVDKVVPTCELMATGDMGKNNWYVSNIEIAFKSTVDNESGIKSATIDKPLITENTNDIVVTGTVVDQAGNSSTCNITVKKDSDRPNCELEKLGTLGKNDYYTSDVDIKFKSATDNLSGVASQSLNRNKITENTNGVDITGTIEDNAGNQNTCTINVKKDSDKPSCELEKLGTLGKNDYYTSNVDIRFKSATDGTSGVASQNLNRNRVTENTNGVDITGTIEDRAGNQNTCTINVKKDSENPSCELEKVGKLGKNDYYTSDVEIRFKTATDNMSGVASQILSQARVTENTNGKNITGTIEDNAGNKSTCTIYVKKDSDRPNCELEKVGTLGKNDYYTSNVDIRFKTTNDGTSGIASQNLNRNSVTENTNGVTITGTIEDNAGNQNTCTTTVKKDTDNPSCELEKVGKLGNNDYFTSDVEIKFKTTNDGTSGILNQYLSQNKITSDTNGVTITGTIEDKAGNQNTCTTTVKKDATPPTVTFSGESNEWTKSDRVITLNCDDHGISGCVENSRQMTFSSNTKTVTRWFEIADRAGNKVSITREFNVYVDKCTSTEPSYGGWSGCSADCGGGTQTRTVTHNSTFGSGFACSYGTDSQSCNTQSCSSGGGGGDSGPGNCRNHCSGVLYSCYGSCVWGHETCECCDC